MRGYSADYTNLHDKIGYSHQGFYCGTDSRSPKGKWKVLLKSKGNYWVANANQALYRKKDGLLDGEFPMYRLLLETVVSINPKKL
mgnify:FL=1